MRDEGVYLKKNIYYMTFYSFLKNSVCCFLIIFCFTTPLVANDSSDKTFIVVALPCRYGYPLDAAHWYTEEYIDYIKTLLPSEKYDVQGYFISQRNISEFIADMKKIRMQRQNLKILNFCDGGEWDGYPCLSLLSAWERDPISKQIPISGANYEFILNSDNKMVMNEWLKKGHLNFLPQALITSELINDATIDTLIKQAHLEKSWPLFCKLNIGAGALGIDKTSICTNKEELLKQLQKMRADYPNSDILVQPYLSGKEYTVLIVNDRAFMSVERIYHNKYNIMLDEYLTGLRPVEEEISYAPSPKEVQNIAVKAVKAIPGKSHYTRVDLRTDHRGNIFVIDINDRPGFGNPSSINTMLFYHHLSDALLLQEIINSSVCH